jgi:micrococcal nuclease
MGRKLSLAALILALSTHSVAYGSTVSESVATAQPAGEMARVAWVTDGDTIVVRVGDREEKVRLIGIDTPELNDERQLWRDQAYAAGGYLRDQLKGRTVTLEPDTIQKNRDEHGRLLRFVILDDRNINLELVRLGYARVYRKFEFHGKAEFLAAEGEARSRKLGVWTLPPGKPRVVAPR